VKQLPDRWTQQQVDDLYAEGVIDSEDEPQTPADEFRDRLINLLDEYVYGDSYGVLGGDFQTCSCCGAGGSPGVKFEHKPDCWAGKVESIIYDQEVTNES
jgi:hypothetical protein